MEIYSKFYLFLLSKRINKQLPYLSLEDIVKIKLLKEDVEKLFFNPKGIHGVDHTVRVMILIAMISNLLRVSDVEKCLLLHAGAIHDIGREKDGICLVHGEKSFQKAMKYKVLNNMTLNENMIIKKIVESHCKSDKEANFVDTNLLVLYKIFKDADGLDRVRLGDLDRSYLRFECSHRLINVAKYLLNNDVNELLNQDLKKLYKLEVY
ncbi:HD domain-containing protein [Clostridiaceae bacterium M8S5]|nr:HD domain-containing protein [Clostridiaceae bacterium M8S5]